MNTLDVIIADYARYKAAKWVYEAAEIHYPKFDNLPMEFVQVGRVPREIRETIVRLFPDFEDLQIYFDLGDVPRSIFNTLVLAYLDVRENFVTKTATKIVSLKQPDYDKVLGIDSIDNVIREFKREDPNFNGDVYLLMLTYFPREYVDIYIADPTDELNMAVKRQFIARKLNRRREVDLLRNPPKSLRPPTTMYVSNLVFRNIFYDKRVINQLSDKMFDMIESVEPLGETEKQALQDVVNVAVKVRNGQPKTRYTEPPTMFSDIGVMLPQNEYLKNPSIAVTRLLALVFSGQFSARDWEDLRDELYLRSDGVSFSMDIWNIPSVFLKKIVPGTASELVLRRLLDTTFFEDGVSFTFSIDFRKKPLSEKTLRFFDSGRVLIQGLQNYLLIFRNGLFAEQTILLFEKENIERLYQEAMHPAYLERIKLAEPYQGWREWLVDQVEEFMAWFVEDNDPIECAICGDFTSMRCSCDIQAYLCEPCFQTHLNQK